MIYTMVGGRAQLLQHGCRQARAHDDRAPPRPPPPPVPVERSLCFLRAASKSIGQPYVQKMELQHDQQMEWLRTFRTSPCVTNAVKPKPTSQELRQQHRWADADT